MSWLFFFHLPRCTGYIKSFSSFRRLKTPFYLPKPLPKLTELGTQKGIGGYEAPSSRISKIEH